MSLSANHVLSADPVDEADILVRIRSKLVNARIQESYRLESQVFLRRGNGKPCRGCDMPILTTDRTSLGYVSTRGERHWFHLLCDTVRQFVAANELKRAPRISRRVIPRETASNFRPAFTDRRPHDV
jgi:hypothetical protein